MSEVARLVGIERRSYMKDGQPRQYCGLHLMYVENSVSGVTGSKVECLSCPREVDSNHLRVGALYDLDYSFFGTSKGKMARLVGLQLVEEK